MPNITVKDDNGDVLYNGPENRQANKLDYNLIWQIMVGAVSIIILGCGAVFAHAQTKFQYYDGVVIDRGERLKELEVNFRTIDIRLTRMENKIDVLTDSLNRLRVFQSDETDYRKNNRK